MSREEVLKILLEDEKRPSADLMEKIERLAEQVETLKNGVELLLSLVVVPQKTACEVFDLNRHTVRKKVADGEAVVLSPDGSRLNFYQLTAVPTLKKRTKPKKKFNKG